MELFNSSLLGSSSSLKPSSRSAFGVLAPTVFLLASTPETLNLVLEVLWHAEMDKELVGIVQRGRLGAASDAPASASLKAANVSSQKE